MRVLKGVLYTTDLQCVTKFSFAKRTVFALRGFCFLIVIKLSYDLEQNATNDETQFDMAVNPL